VLLTIRRFVPADQAPARALIEESLGDHFGHVDRDANPDLVDIQASYSSGAFFVADRGGEIVGTAGVIVEANRCRMVRVAVARRARRQGVASALLERVLEFTEQRGLAEIVAHTQPEWPDAVGFYRAHGFEPYGRDEVDVRLRKALALRHTRRPSGA
jgi:ribosomal protein S18 acetylase RimI-like enzyme